MKVFVFFKFHPFGNEQIVLISKNKKKGEKKLREMFPYMKPTGEDSYMFDQKACLLGMIREMEVVE